MEDNLDIIKISSIQFKRGSKTTLINKLKGDNKPKAGEPIFETDTNRLKIGDGIHDYEDLTYTVDIEEINRIYSKIKAEATKVETIAEQVSIAAVKATNASVKAEAAASKAEQAQSYAETVVEQLPELVKTAGDAWVKQTFWHGTWAEYEALPEIFPETIYIIEY